MNELIKIPSAVISGSAQLPDNKVWEGDATGTAQAVTLSGDVTTNDTGVVTLATTAVTAGSYTIAALTVDAKGRLTAASSAATTGSGSVVLATSPTLITPALGTPSALVGTNITGTAAGLTAGTVTTNANLTGPITSVGNATSIASQTGTGTKFVVDTSPTLVTPNLGTPSTLVLTNASGIPTSAVSTSTANTMVLRDTNKNSLINNITESFVTTATAAGTTTLTVSSAPLQQFTGTTTQQVNLPDCTTLTTGFVFTVFNRSTGNVTVKDAAGGTVQIMNGGSQVTLTCANIGSAAGLWDVSYTYASLALTNGQLLIGSTGLAPVAASLTGTANQIIVTPGAGSITLATPQSIATSSSPTFTSLTLSGNLTFSTSTDGIVGTTTNDDAAAGNVGQYINSSIGATNYPTSGNWGDLTSISLTSGDWDVSCSIFSAASSSTLTDAAVGISSTSGNTAPTAGDAYVSTILPVTATRNGGGGIYNVRFSLSATTTIYLKYYAVYSVATPQAQGSLRARRRR